MSTDEVSLEGRGLLFLKSSTICTSSCVFHAFSPPAFITVLPHLGLLCHCIHPPLLFLPPSLYSRFLPSSLVLFVLRSLNCPWEWGHPVQGGFCGKMKHTGRWAGVLSFLCLLSSLSSPHLFSEEQKERPLASSCTLVQPPVALHSETDGCW